MRKAIAVALSLGLLVGAYALPADAAKKKKKKKKKKKIERVVEIEYGAPGIGVAPLGGYPVNFPEGVDVPTVKTDLFLKIEVEDSSGQNVWGFISQGDLDGNGVNDDGYARFCGAHEEPVEVVEPGMPIIGVYMYNGVCDPSTGGGPSVMTSGTIKMTFTNMP